MFRLMAVSHQVGIFLRVQLSIKTFVGVKVVVQLGTDIQHISIVVLKIVGQSCRFGESLLSIRFSVLTPMILLSVLETEGFFTIEPIFVEIGQPVGIVETHFRLAEVQLAIGIVFPPSAFGALFAIVAECTYGGFQILCMHYSMMH